MGQDRVTSANDLNRGLSFSVSDVSSAASGSRKAFCGCISSPSKVERGNGTSEYVCMMGEVG